MTDAKSLIIRLYFTVVSAATLIVLMIGLIGLIGFGLRAGLFPAANVPGYLEVCTGESRMKPVTPDQANDFDEAEWRAECEERNEANIENYRRQQASNAVDNFAMILVALPLFLLHFRFVYRDWMGEKK